MNKELVIKLLAEATIHSKWYPSDPIVKLLHDAAVEIQNLSSSEEPVIIDYRNIESV